MAGEKQICCSIMICQMTAILSGVAMLYLAVIVVIPAQDELEAGYHREPIMCTTIQAEDITAGGKKVECKWSTCGEWCLSKSSTPCMQIHVMARNNGSAVKFSTCFDVYVEKCTALNASLALSKKCKLGECRELTGLFNCTKEGENPCKDITPAYNCLGGSINRDTILCTEEKCEERLSGVYTCTAGSCNRLDHVRDYWKDCQRKCTDLRLTDINVIIFNNDHFIATKCESVSSSKGNNTIEDLNATPEWSSKRKVLFIYCTYYDKTHGVRGYDLHTGDCFNATLGEADRLATMTNFLDVLDYAAELYNQSDFLIDPEESLRIMNNTELLINKEGCVNSLRKECKAFFATHAQDGRDGQPVHRYPCYYSDLNPGSVIGKYNPDMTYLYLMFASYVPVSLFVFSCFCLFVCSKSVGVDESGHLKVTLMQGGGQGEETTPMLLLS